MVQYLSVLKKEKCQTIQWKCEGEKRQNEQPRTRSARSNHCNGHGRDSKCDVTDCNKSTVHALAAEREQGIKYLGNINRCDAAEKTLSVYRDNVDCLSSRGGHPLWLQWRWFASIIRQK